MRTAITEQQVSKTLKILKFLNLCRYLLLNVPLFLFQIVYHADGALKIAPACLKFKLLKAESLALLGRTEVRANYFMRL